MRVVAATEGLARNAVALRITVGLIGRAVLDLRRTQERTGLSVADIVNRALTLYEFVDSCRAAGDQILVRRRGAGRVDLVQLS
jgi:ribosomal protein L34